MLTAEMNGKTFEFSSQLEFLERIDPFIEEFPQGGLLTFTAPDGDKWTVQVPTHMNGDEKKTAEFWKKHGITIL